MTSPRSDTSLETGVESPSTANSPTPSSPSGRGRGASHCHLCHRRSACGQPPPRHRATASYTLLLLGAWRPPHLSPTGSQPGPASWLWLQLQWQSLLAATAPSVSLSLCSARKRVVSASVNLFIPHTQGQHGSDEEAPGRGIGLHLPAPLTPGSRAITAPLGTTPSAHRTGQS